MWTRRKISLLLSQLWEIFGEKAILKGGTALNRVYLARIGVARFSEDIDIDYFNGNVETSAREIVEGMKKIKGFNVKEPRVLHRTFRFDCYYINTFGNRDRVKVEFYLSRPPYIEARVELVKSPFILLEGPFRKGGDEKSKTLNIFTIYNSKWC